MKKSLSFIKNKIVLLSTVIVATVVGGATTAVVLAAIPDSDGVIHSCRLNIGGTIRIIDSASQSCNGLETALNWSQGGGGAALHDANGQLLGSAMDAPDGGGGPFVVYSSTLNRFITISYSDAGHYAITSPGLALYFQSNDCTGSAYTYNDPHNGMKTSLIRVNTSTYAVVQDNASAQNITVSSIRQYDLSTDSFTCQDIDDAADTFYTLTSASLPFTMPLVGPFKF
jgi:hypothetical protein